MDFNEPVESFAASFGLDGMKVDVFHEEPAGTVKAWKGIASSPTAETPPAAGFMQV